MVYRIAARFIDSKNLIFNVLKTVVSILIKKKINRRHASGGVRLVAWCEAVSRYGYIATDLDHASRLSPLNSLRTFTGNIR